MGSCQGSADCNRATREYGNIGTLNLAKGHLSQSEPVAAQGHLDTRPTAVIQDDKL